MLLITNLHYRFMSNDFEVKS